jgi:phosphoribosylanthranilate isomerase
MTVRVKICGLTNEADALAAARLGADALGFVFAPSPRQISAERAQEIIGKLPPLIRTVGVFVNEDPETVAATAGFCHLDLVQFHGRESPSYCREFGRGVIKAVRPRCKSEVAELSAYSNAAQALLLDTYVPDQYGGTGLTFDWDLALEARRYGWIILAGGLNPENVASAIQQARPYAVDASSGLERRPGVKDHEKVARFIAAVRRATMP